MLAMKGNSKGEGKNLEINVLVEADEGHSSHSDSEDGLACCTCEQAAGMLEEYEEDCQQLPGDGGYGTEDEDGLTGEEFNIICTVSQFAEDEAESDSDNEYEVDGGGSKSSSEDDEGNGNFVPTLKLNRKAMPKQFKGTGGKVMPKFFKVAGGKKCPQKVKNDANYVFCPLSHQVLILCLMFKHFCQHPILPECHGQSCTHQQIHHDAVLKVYYHCKANNLQEV